MIPTMRDAGAYVKDTKGINPADAGAGTTNGGSIDRQGYMSCVLHGACGAATGSPTAQTVNQKIQDSSTGTSAWTDIADAAITALAANNTDAEVDVDLSAAKQFIRVVSVVAFTGGTSPKIPVASTVTLGGADVLPT